MALHSFSDLAAHGFYLLVMQIFFSNFFLHVPRVVEVWCRLVLFEFRECVMRSVPVVCDELERLAKVNSEWAVGARWALAWVLDFDVADDGGELV